MPRGKEERRKNNRACAERKSRERLYKYTPLSLLEETHHAGLLAARQRLRLLRLAAQGPVRRLPARDVGGVYSLAFLGANNHIRCLRVCAG